MDKIKVSYQKEWCRDGTVYTQTITIKKDFFRTLNDSIKEEINNNYKNCKLYACGDRLRATTYLQELDTNKNKHFLRLTQLNFIIPYLQNSRVKKDRNTILKVV